MIYKLQNGRTIPLGGDYLEYLQSIPETYGGSIQPSIKVESLPKKFNGSQQAARTYAEGYQKGAKPVTKAIDNAGQKIFNTTKNVAMFVPGPTGAITWLGQMGADTANGEYSKVAKDLGAAILMGAGLKGAQIGAKAAGRALAGKGVNIPWLDAYDYSALRNEYLNRAAKRTRTVTPNKGWEDLSNFDVYQDVFYNRPAIEITEPVTNVPNIPGIKVGNPKDIAGLKVSPSSAMETGYIDFFDESKPFRKDLRKIFNFSTNGEHYHFGRPIEQGVIYRTRDGYEFLEYPRGSNVRYYTGKIKTEGNTPTLVHTGEPHMEGRTWTPKPDPLKRNDTDYIWWQRNSPWVSHGKYTTRINEEIPTKAAWGSDYTNPIRLSESFDLLDPNLNATMMRYDPATHTFARVKYHIPQSTVSPQEAATTYHFDGRMPLSKSIGIAEKAGIPKGDRGLFNWDQIPDLIPRFNKWAQYYGYETIPESTSIQDAVNIMKNTFKRHNTFFRGVHNPDIPEDASRIEALFGKDYDLDDVYKYVATHGRPGDNAVFISPLSNAGIYGSTGKTAIVRRRFKLGKNPETWLHDADFDIIFGGSPKAIKAAQEKNTFTFPWSERGHGTIENELLAPDGTINFVDFVPQNASTSYFDLNGSLNKYLGYKSFHDMYGFGDYNRFTDVPIEKPKFKQGGKI